MKVKCIRGNGTWEHIGKFITTGILFWKTIQKVYTTGPEEGDIVTVLSEFWDEGVKYYRLVEWPKGTFGYDSRNFKPVEEQYDKIKVSEIKEAPCVN